MLSVFKKYLSPYNNMFIICDDEFHESGKYRWTFLFDHDVSECDASVAQIKGSRLQHIKYF